MFGTVKAGLIGRHLTFLPAAGNTIGPDDSCTAQFFTLGRSRRGSKSSGAQLLIA